MTSTLTTVETLQSTAGALTFALEARTGADYRLSLARTAMGRIDEIAPTVTGKARIHLAYAALELAIVTETNPADVLERIARARRLLRLALETLQAA